MTEEALRGAKAVVVLWSKKPVVSRWVRAEATLADGNRTLVLARIEACDLQIMFKEFDPNSGPVGIRTRGRGPCVAGVSGRCPSVRRNR